MIARSRRSRSWKPRRRPASSTLSRDNPQASVLQAGRTPSDAVIATLPRCARDRALTGGEAAPLDQPRRASHRSGHDDAKALLQAHRHVISRGSRRTGDAELFAVGQDAQQIFLHGWMAGLDGGPPACRSARALSTRSPVVLALLRDGAPVGAWRGPYRTKGRRF